MKTITTQASDNLFIDLGFSNAEATILKMRADLMNHLRTTIEAKGWTQTAAAGVLGISQARVSDLVRGKWDKFSLDMLVTLLVRSGQQCEMAVH